MTPNTPQRWLSGRGVARGAYANRRVGRQEPLHPHHLVGVLPLWLTLLPIVLFGVLQQPAVLRQLRTGPLGRWRSAPVCLHVVVVAAIVYALGWGPVLPLAFALVVTHHLQTDSGVLWRPAVLAMTASIAAGQVGIALGWTFSYLSPQHAQVAGLLGLLLTAMFIRAFGLSAEQRERAETTLADREKRFRILVQDSHDVISVLTKAGVPIYLSPAIRQVTGFPPEHYQYGGYADHVHPDDLPALDATLERVSAQPGGEHVVHARIRHVDGGWRWMEATMRDLHDEPAVGGVVCTFRDVTERHLVQEQLAHEAAHDQLTGLKNRASFLRELEESAEQGQLPAVLFVDLDGFKPINDTHGHRYGDEVLVAVAEMLRRSISGVDVACRMGGDEFAIALTAPATVDRAAEVAERLMQKMKSPVTVDGKALRVRASIGIAVPDDAETAVADLLHRADLAMYAAKRRGTHGAQLYDSSVTQTSAVQPADV